ncbi:MAG: hypothetical protein ACRD0U_15900 [Acidimicrobiales bacterium]
MEDRASVAGEVLARDAFVLASTINGTEPWKPSTTPSPGFLRDNDLDGFALPR